jgi:hypothetical protein
MNYKLLKTAKLYDFRLYDFKTLDIRLILNQTNSKALSTTSYIFFNWIFVII